MSWYHYAAYGSNLHPFRLGKRIASAELLGTRVLTGHELRFNKAGFNDSSGKCNVNTGSNAVHLAIYRIKESERATLDRVEGLGKGYDSLTIRLEGFGGCSIYVADAIAINDGLQPMDWYKEMVLLGCRLHGFPNDYVRAIENIEPITDPDENRAHEQWQIVEELRSAS